MKQSTFEALCWPFVVLFFVIAATFLSTIVGAVCGWCVGLLFDNSILSVLESCGIGNVSMWQFGAFLGFVVSFFKSFISFDMNRYRSLKK